MTIRVVKWIRREFFWQLTLEEDEGQISVVDVSHQFALCSCKEAREQDYAIAHQIAQGVVPSPVRTIQCPHFRFLQLPLAWSAGYTFARWKQRYEQVIHFEATECAFCFEEWSPELPEVLGVCGHRFHEKCMCAWQLSNARRREHSCIICRQPWQLSTALSCKNESF